MLQLLKQATNKYKIYSRKIYEHYSSKLLQKKSGKAFFIVTAGTGLASTVVYSKYNSQLKNAFEKNIPYIEEIYKLLPDIDEPKKLTLNTTSDDKNESLIPKKSSFVKSKTDNDINQLKSEDLEQSLLLPEKLVLEPSLNNKLLADLSKQLESSCVETISAYENAAEVLRKHYKLLYEALSSSVDYHNTNQWEQAYRASNDRLDSIKIAEEKASTTKALIDKLKMSTQNAAIQDSERPLIKMCEDTIEKVTKQLNDSKTKMEEVENEIKNTSEHHEFVNNSQEKLRQKLENMLPHYVHRLNNSTTIPEEDLILDYAHQRIQQLQKQLTNQKVTENYRTDAASKQQKLGEDSLKSKIEAEFRKRDIEVQAAVARKLPHLKEDLESELEKVLSLQTAAHLDHIQEVLKTHEQELKQKFTLDSEKELLNIESILMSSVSYLLSGLDNIIVYLKTETELYAESKKALSLWLSCQVLSEKISSAPGKLSPLAADIALIKLFADKNTYLNTVLAGMPFKALSRGVYTPEALKQRFLDVKKICRKVAIINETNDSLYHYLLSYLQSYLTVDEISIPQAEIDGIVAIDPCEWDTYDILSRISYYLKTNDLEQALRCANLLKGEAKTVANDWVLELKLYLETQTVVKALMAYAASVNVQAYH